MKKSVHLCRVTELFIFFQNKSYKNELRPNVRALSASHFNNEIQNKTKTINQRCSTNLTEILDFIPNNDFSAAVLLIPLVQRIFAAEHVHVDVDVHVEAERGAAESAFTREYRGGGARALKAQSVKTCPKKGFRFRSARFRSV